jgi:hypothetical protein
MEVGEHRPGSGRPEGDTEAAAALTLNHAAGYTTRTVYCCSKIGTAERWIFSVSATVASALTRGPLPAQGRDPSSVLPSRRRLQHSGVTRDGGLVFDRRLSIVVTLHAHLLLIELVRVSAHRN